MAWTVESIERLRFQEEAGSSSSAASSSSSISSSGSSNASEKRRSGSRGHGVRSSSASSSSSASASSSSSASASSSASSSASADRVFVKVICARAFPQSAFRRMHEAYTALTGARRCEEERQAAAAADFDPPPVSLLPARLLYGSGAVAVEMLWCSGRDAHADDFSHGDTAFWRPIAAAVAWLARHGLIYTDLRPVNVRLPEGSEVGAAGAVLIDYDDMVVSTESIATLEDFEAQLRQALDQLWAHALPQKPEPYTQLCEPLRLALQEQRWASARP